MACFNDLPSEIRNIMYEELLGCKSKPQSRIPNELAMFTVSKQLHSESSSYFYQHNDIVINAPSAATNMATILPPVSDQYLRYIMRLTIHTHTGQAIMPQIHKVANAIAALSGIGARFTELNILIASPLSHLLNSRVDDSVLGRTHPITLALRTVLASKVAKVLRVQLENTSFAPGIARGLKADFHSQVQFLVNGSLVLDTSVLERQLTGRFLSTHLLAFGLNDEVDGELTSSPVSTPSSLPSSLCSVFADLDTFSVTSFEMGSEEAGAQWKDLSDSLDNDTTGRQPFFAEDDIEEWSASTQEYGQEEEVLGDADDAVEDEEMEDIQQDEISAIMQNMEETAHHAANNDDVTYMTNFAPDLLLSRHHLGHLV